MEFRKRQLVADVLVAGGGPAGAAAALAAAREGARTLLVQNRPVLGGNASSEIRMHIVGADCHGKRGSPLACEAREGGILEELRLHCAVRNPQRSNSMLDLILYEMCRAEPNLETLLNTEVLGARTENGRIRSVLASRPSTEESFEIEAAVYIDCTGDGRLGASAGAPYRMGREGRSEYGESLAPEKPDAFTLGSSLLYQARRHDRPMPFVAPPWARRFEAEDLKLRLPFKPGQSPGDLDYGFWWVEWGGTLDTIRDNECIRDELLAIVLGVWDHIKNSGLYPGAEFWALEWFGFLPGKRESRRFIGRHVLTQHDVMESRPQPDAIAYGGWPIDLHPPRGVDARDEAPCTQHRVPRLYDIPLRCCVTEHVPNLMFAGRNFSATHVAFASTRVMGTCFAVGQGVGVAAAVAARHHVDPAHLPDSPERMKEIQQALLRADAFLIGLRNEDPRDAARVAAASASSERADGAARNAIDGITRATHAADGSPSDRVEPGTHRWISDPSAGFPAWLQLEWPAPVAIHQIELIFDTGLHRELTLTMSERIASRMQWGRPQEETVRDYRIEAWLDGAWRVVADASGNYMRRRVHRLGHPLSTSSLRVIVEATNGVPEARICEIRVY